MALVPPQRPHKSPPDLPLLYLIAAVSPPIPKVLFILKPGVGVQPGGMLGGGRATQKHHPWFDGRAGAERCLGLPTAAQLSPTASAAPRSSPLTPAVDSTRHTHNPTPNRQDPKVRLADPGNMILFHPSRPAAKCGRAFARQRLPQSRALRAGRIRGVSSAPRSRRMPAVMKDDR